MRQIKKSLNKYAFNEDELLKRIQMQAKQEGLNSRWSKAKENTMKKNGLFKWGLLTFLVIGVALMVPLLTPKSNSVMAYVSVDINPSFELTVLEDQTVSEIEALNEDAQSLMISDLIGLPQDEVIDAIVNRSADAGFIDLLDLEDDYVLITTVPAKDATEPELDQLSLQLQERIQVSEMLQSVNVVEIKTDLITKFEAEEKNVPIGLYVINGQVLQVDGTYLSAKEYFSNNDNLNQLQAQLKVKLTLHTEEKVRERIEATLNQLEGQGLNIEAYRQRLDNANSETLNQIQAELLNQIKDQENRPFEPKDNGNKPDQSTDTPSNSNNGENTNGSNASPTNGSDASPTNGQGSNSPDNGNKN